MIDIRFTSNIIHIMIQFDLVRRVNVDRISVLVNRILLGLNCFSIMMVRFHFKGSFRTILYFEQDRN